MGQLFKYILYALFGIMAILWGMQVFKACNKSKDTTSETTTTLQGEDGDKTASLNIEDEEKDGGEDLIVYNEEDEGFDEDDEYLDEYEETDGTLEDEERTTASSGQDFTSAPRGDKEVGVDDEFTRKGGDSSEDGKFMVIAGSFENPANARTLAAQLQQKGYEDAEIVKFDFSGFHSVCVGRYHDKGDANGMAANLKKDKIPAYVHLRRSKK